jgi:pimeloyl-ACP methyl ester carboxylesterase
LLLWGDKDKVISPYHAKYYKDNINSLKYEKIEGAGHMLIRRESTWKIISDFIENGNR